VCLEAAASSCQCCSRRKQGGCYIPSRGQMTGCRPVVRKPVTGRKYRIITR
jgi:hypothetical protein